MCYHVGIGGEMNKIVKLLDEKREAMGMSGNQFADYLGISRATWSRIKSGNRAPGWKVRHLAAKRFPKCRHIFLAIDPPTLVQTEGER